MSTEHTIQEDPRIGPAVADLQEKIRAVYPTATFEVAPGEDPEGTYVWATVDAEDTDTVLDVVLDRLLELQVDERLPVHVIPVRTPERVLASMQSARLRGRHRGSTLPSLERALTGTQP